MFRLGSISRSLRTVGRLPNYARYCSGTNDLDVDADNILNYSHHSGAETRNAAMAASDAKLLLLNKKRSFCQENENDTASFALVHFPGAEMVYGSYHPLGALYNQGVSIIKARNSVRALVDKLVTHNVDVLGIGDILRMGIGLDDRCKLEEFALSAITYDTTARSLTAAEAMLMSLDYKRSAVEQMDTFDLIDAIITRPKITLEKSFRNTPLTSTNYSFSPLTNLVFTRDGMIVTANGVVLAQPHSTQRSAEVKLLEFCLNKLGIPTLGQIPLPGKLEGGDFFPAGRDLCFIGLGIRTNTEAVRHLLRNKWFGSERVAVVKDIMDRKQARMHLDCVFNIAGDNVAVLADSVAGRWALSHRLVAEYTLINGEYQLTRDNVEFEEYLNSVGFNVIRVSDRMLDNYGINFVNTGNSRLITTDAETATHISNSRHFTGTIDVIDFKEITKLYGAIHCSTQFFREPRPEMVSRQPVQSESLQLVSRVDIPQKEEVKLEKTRQTTNHVLCVAPTYFAQNPETLQDNAFMQTKAAQTMTSLEIVEQACTSFSRLYNALVSNGVKVQLYHHESYHDTPDAVFPNNWMSTHSESDTVVFYPMKYPSRSRERRPSMIQFLKARHEHVLDLTYHESDEDATHTKALEGTGALVLDRVNKVAYCAISLRADREVLNEWAGKMGYTLCTFGTTDNIYHTNVMMSLGSSMAVICPEAIVEEDRTMVLAKLKASGRYIMKVERAQMDAFLCNCIELQSKWGKSLMFMSTQAFEAMTESQLYMMNQHVDKVVAVDFTIIERVAGGGVRCAIGELF